MTTINGKNQEYTTIIKKSGISLSLGKGSAGKPVILITLESEGSVDFKFDFFGGSGCSGMVNLEMTQEVYEEIFREYSKVINSGEYSYKIRSAYSPVSPSNEPVENDESSQVLGFANKTEKYHKKVEDVTAESELLELEEFQSIISVLKKSPPEGRGFYRELLKGLTAKQKKKLFQISMEDKELACHAMKIQSTYFDGAKGGFHENIGGNGAMDRRW